MEPTAEVKTTAVCASAEVAVEIAALSSRLNMEVETVVDPRPIAAAARLVGPGELVGAVAEQPPAPAQLVELAERSLAQGSRATVAILGAESQPLAMLELASDLGLVAVAEVAPMVSALALLLRGGDEPHRASVRSLSAADRVRLASVCSATDRASRGRRGRFTREDDGLLGFTLSGPPAYSIGSARDVAPALLAMRAALPKGARPAFDSLDGKPPEKVSEILFGPRRALSDPASKTALSRFGVPLPQEELCTSPSRASAEAARMGFPVRLSLASPDLRIWDHPDLCVDGIDTGARVKEVFRQLMSLAESRSPQARLLGMTVTTTRATRALLRVVARPLWEDLVLMELGFADPHGIASGDHTHTVLPATRERIQHALSRLAGSPLLLPGTQAERRYQADALHDVLGRVGAFVSLHRDEVETVEIDPLAILVGGEIEVREACVQVSDAFQRSLESPA